MYKSRRASEGLCQRRGNAFAVGAQRSACRTRGRKVVTLAADANGGLYVDGMRAHCTAVATSCTVQPLAGDRVCVIVDGDKLVITGSCRASRRTPS